MLKNDYYTIRYRRTTIRLKKNPRKNKCECCGIKSKQLHAHHWKYDYPTKEVKKNPILAIHNISTLCYNCHLLANSLKHVLEEPFRVFKLLKMCPHDMINNYFVGLNFANNKK